MKSGLNAPAFYPRFTAGNLRLFLVRNNRHLLYICRRACYNLIVFSGGHFYGT